MKPRFHDLFSLATVAIGLFASRCVGDEIPPQSVDGKITWVYGYEAGKQESLRSGKPMFVVFRCER